jgi:hypothetical protein
MIFTAQINLPIGSPPASLYALIWNMIPFPSRALLKLETKALTLQLDAPIPAGAVIQIGSATSGMAGFELDAASPQYRLETPISLGELTLANFGPVAAMVNATVEQED